MKTKPKADIEQYIPLAKQIAARVHAGRRLPAYLRDEMEAAAIEALPALLQKVSPDHPTFIGYARRRLMGAALTQLRRNDEIAEHIRAKARKPLRFRESFLSQHGRQPTLAEIKKKFPTTPRLKYVLDAVDSAANKTGRKIGHQVERVTNVNTAYDDNEMFRRLLQIAKPKQRRVLKLLYQDGLSIKQATIKMKLSNTKKTIRLRNAALKQLRNCPQQICQVYGADGSIPGQIGNQWMNAAYDENNRQIAAN